MLYAIVVGIFVGYVAQKWKGRTGAFWGITAIFLWVCVYLLTYMSGADIVAKNPDSGLTAVNLTASLVTSALFLLIIATLPSKK